MSPAGRLPALLLLLPALATCDVPEGEMAADGPPVRIVSLVPSATRTLTALGAGDRLVGRTDFDTARALRDLPSVGGGLQPSLEVLVSLRPDLVVRFEGPSDRGTPVRLEEAGIDQVAVRPERIAEVETMIRELGRIVGQPERADSIVRAHRRVLDSVRTAARERDTVSVAFTLGGDPPYVAGPATYVGELLEAAGGRNVFSDLERPWAGVSPETLVDRDPRILVVPEGTELDPRLARGRTVRTVPPVVQLPGPDLPEAARAISRALRPPGDGPP